MKAIFFGDFHFDGAPASGGLPVQYQTAVADDPVLLLIKHLKTRYEQEKVSLIVFLGDYGKGKARKEEKLAAFERIKRFAQRIEEECAGIFDPSDDRKDRIVFVDGNHDVSREEDHHADFETVFGAYLTPFTEKTGVGARRYGAPIFDFEGSKLRVACISTTQNAGASFRVKALEELRDVAVKLEASAPEAYKRVMELLETEEKIDIGSITADAIARIRDEGEDDRETKLVVSHHPLIQMQHATAAHFETVNGPRLFDLARGKRYRYFISGHLHEFYCVDLRSRGKDPLPDATLISVPTVMDPSGSGARYVELDVREDQYTCRLLAYDEKRDRIEEKEVASNNSSGRSRRSGEHILLDVEIQALIEEGEIMEGASTERIQAISYDCALGFHYKRYDRERKTWPDDFEEMRATPGAPAKIALDPGERVLLYTHEEFHMPADMMLHASPRASWIRRGISAELSFVVEPCFEGPLCFPVTNKNEYPVEISAQEPIISVTFHQLSGKVGQGWSERDPAAVSRRKNKRDK